MGNKSANRISFILGNIVWYSSGIAGMKYSNTYAWNTFTFFTWFLVFMWTLLGLGKIAGDFQGKPLEIEDRGFPSYISAITDYTLAFIAAAFGHWFYGVLIVYQQVVETFVYYKSSERKQK